MDTVAPSARAGNYHARAYETLSEAAQMTLARCIPRFPALRTRALGRLLRVQPRTRAPGLPFPTPASPCIQRFPIALAVKRAVPGLPKCAASAQMPAADSRE